MDLTQAVLDAGAEVCVRARACARVWEVRGSDAAGAVSSHGCAERTGKCKCPLRQAVMRGA